DIGIVEKTDDGHDFAGGPSRFGRKPRDLDFNDLVFVFRHVVGDDDLGRQLLIRRGDKEPVAIKPQLSNNRISGPLLDADHAPLGSASLFAIGDLGFHLIAVHRGTNQRSRYIDVAVEAFDSLARYDKAIPITMNQNGTVDEITRGDLVPITAMLREFSISDELIEDASDLSSSSWCGVKVFEDCLQVRPPIRGLSYVSDQILLTDVRLPSSAGSSPRVLHPHGSSLLTSIIEEHRFISVAEMAELADALDSGSSPRKGVEVRVLFSASHLLAYPEPDHDFIRMPKNCFVYSRLLVLLAFESE